MLEINSDGILIRSENIVDETAINEIEEIVGDGCFIHIQRISSNKIKISVDGISKKNKFSFIVSPHYDSYEGKIKINCSGGITNGESSSIIRFKEELLEENEKLKNQLEFVKKNLNKADIDLAIEKAQNKIRSNELKDKINILESKVQILENRV